MEKNKTADMFSEITKQLTNLKNTLRIVFSEGDDIVFWEYVPIKTIISKKTTICFFDDDTKIISRPSKDDAFNIQIGIAECIAKKICGSRSQLAKLSRGISESSVSILLARKACGGKKQFDDLCFRALASIKN